MVFFSSQNELLVRFVHNDIGAAGYTAGTHTTCNYCCMAGHTTADSQDTLSSLHTFNIFRRGLQTNQNYLLAFCLPSLCIFCCKYDLTAGSTW